jgi:hypothetical protein
MQLKDHILKWGMLSNRSLISRKAIVIHNVYLWQSRLG